MNSIKHDCALHEKTGGSKIIKRRNFRGNKYSNDVSSAAASNDISITTSTFKSTSAKKITTKNNVYSNIPANVESDNEELLLGNDFFPSTTLLVDSDILKAIIKLLRSCPNCSNQSINVKCDQSQKKGLYFLLNFVCDSEICNWKQSYYTSNTAQEILNSFLCSVNI